MTHFYDHVMVETREISAIIRDDVDMVSLTSEQEKEHEEATTCRNCNKPFASKNWKVRHHCHISGQYLFAACNNCNLQLKPLQCKKKKKPQKEGTKRHRQTTSEWAAEQYENEYFLPIVFHNLKGYDAHFVIKHFQRKFTKRILKNDKITYDDVTIIPLNSEQYLQFQIGELRFLDSYQFLSASLDQLVSCF